MRSRGPAAGAWRTAGWWVVGLGLLALFVAANAAAYVPPERWWPLQLLGIAVPVLGVLLVLTGAVAAFVRRWWLGGVLALAVVFAVVLPRTLFPSPVLHRPLASEVAAHPTAAHPTAEPLRVMTFNANPERLRVREGLPALLDREEPHIVALQEFDVRLDRATGIRSGPPFLGPFIKGNRFGISWPESEGDVEIRQPILSRLEPTEPAEIVPYNPAGRQQEGMWASGGITRGTYRWRGRTIAVYSVHLHSFGRERPWQESWRHALSPEAWANALRTYRGDFETRASQARVLRRMLEEEEHPFIVCGDLNSTPHNWVYAHLVRGLTDAFRVAGQGRGATFPAHLPMFRIDFVIVSEDWAVRQAYVSEAVTSDHVPMIAELVLRPPGDSDPEP